jgi:hypothetical protein
VDRVRAQLTRRCSHRAELLALGALVGVGLLARTWILVAGGQFSSDEAVPGLMARHILTAHELPVFYWGQDYFGAAEAYLIAGLFWSFGFWPWLVFVPAVLASCALILLTWRLGTLLGPSPAGVIAAIPMGPAPARAHRGLRRWRPWRPRTPCAPGRHRRCASR